METQWTRMTADEAAEIIQHNDIAARAILLVCANKMKLRIFFEIKMSIPAPPHPCPLNRFSQPILDETASKDR